MTTMTWTPSPAQINLVGAVFGERVAKDVPDRVAYWRSLTARAVVSLDEYQAVLSELKARPKVGEKPVVLPTLASEDGLYRDPADGTLYRLSTPKPKNRWDRPQTIVSIYSKKAAQRRLTVHGESVKGKWERQNATTSRSFLRYSHAQRNGFGVVGNKILADWRMSDQDKMDYRYGICLFCYRGLKDERSVRHGYGPDCAKDRGLPWND